MGKLINLEEVAPGKFRAPTKAKVRSKQPVKRPRPPSGPPRAANGSQGRPVSWLASSIGLDFEEMMRKEFAGVARVVRDIDRIAQIVEPYLRGRS